MKKLAILFIIACTLIFGCDKDENNYLQGTWVKSEVKTDTLQFQSSTGILWLSRGTEIRNGYELPKIGSGPYTYTIKKDSIFLNSLLSSLFVSKPYYFQINDNNIVISNFYDENLDTEYLTFIKLD